MRDLLELGTFDRRLVGVDPAIESLRMELARREAGAGSRSGARRELDLRVEKLVARCVAQQERIATLRRQSCQALDRLEAALGRPPVAR